MEQQIKGRPHQTRREKEHAEQRHQENIEEVALQHLDKEEAYRERLRPQILAEEGEMRKEHSEYQNRPRLREEQRKRRTSIVKRPIYIEAGWPKMKNYRQRMKPQIEDQVEKEEMLQARPKLTKEQRKIRKRITTKNRYDRIQLARAAKDER